MRPRLQGEVWTVHGVVCLSYGPARMDVVAGCPNPDKLGELVRERVPRVACVRNLKKRPAPPASSSRRSAREGTCG